MDESEKEDFTETLCQARYNLGDFELTENDIPQTTQGIYPVKSKIAVTCKKTGVFREYSGGHGTAWLGDFEKDLKAGIFGKP